VSESRSGEHQQLMELVQAEVSEPTAEITFSNVSGATEQAEYVVMVRNSTAISGTLALAYRTSDNPAQVTRQSLPAGGSVVFQLAPPGQCASLQAYVMVFFYGDRRLVSPPDAETGGEWTPERISEEFPQDQDPCVDSWVI
jgi:hypothetical protein